jgi:hypothetical protein
MWTLEKEPRRKEPRRRRGASRGVAVLAGGPREAAVAREATAAREAAGDRARVHAWTAGRPEDTSWREVEAVVFRRAGREGPGGPADGVEGPNGGTRARLGGGIDGVEGADGGARGRPGGVGVGEGVRRRDETGSAPEPGRSAWLAGARADARAPGPRAPVARPPAERLAPETTQRAGGARGTGPDAARAGHAGKPGVGPLAPGAGSIDVVGVREPLLTHVQSALWAAGLAAEVFPGADAYLDARDAAPSDRRSGRAQAAGPESGANRVLWSVEEPAPPRGAVLVGADGEEAWALGARHPGLPLVTLPSGATWLGARWGTRSCGGVVLAVGGLGGSGGSQRAALALARAAEAHGDSVVLVDADPSSAARWDTEPGTPGWEAARRWAVDGSVAGLPRLLATDGGIARLGWGGDEDPARLGPRDVEAVCGALAQSFELVILSVGALAWPLHRSPGGAAHVLACASGVGGWPRHRSAGASVSVAVLRGRGRSPDGPELARLTGSAWAGSAPDPAGSEPGRALSRLAHRLWLPRLLAGLPPGVA